MKVKTSEVRGPALDWAVAKAEGAMHPVGNVMLIEGKYLLITVGGDPDHGDSRVYYAPSSDWSQGGPIIEREKVSIELKPHGYWMASYQYNYADEKRFLTLGDTPLIAAMRCYVASKLGDEVEIPEELI